MSSDLSNYQSLVIELFSAIFIGALISLYFYNREKDLSKNQKEIVEKIKDLTTEQSRLIKIMEERRKDRIRWFKHTSLMLLNSVKERYEKLSDAVDNFEKTDSDGDLKKIEINAKTGIFSVNYARDIIDRDLLITAEHLENTRLIAKLPDYLLSIDEGFKMAKRSPMDFENIRESMKESVKNLNSIIDDINSEKET